jgi:hypothetical protein
MCVRVIHSLSCINAALVRYFKTKIPQIFIRIHFCIFNTVNVNDINVKLEQTCMFSALIMYRIEEATRLYRVSFLLPGRTGYTFRLFFISSLFIRNWSWNPYFCVVHAYIPHRGSRLQMCGPLLSSGHHEEAFVPKYRTVPPVCTVPALLQGGEYLANRSSSSHDGLNRIVTR